MLSEILLNEAQKALLQTFVSRTLLAILFAGLLSQGSKIILALRKSRKLSWKDILVTGGMPSSHSALVTALVLIILFLDGVSMAFVISLVLAVIVIRDAYGVRRAVGEEGLILKKLMKKTGVKGTVHFAMGHKPIEVLVGVIIGVLAAVIAYVI
jgi:uncharacterized protein